MMHSHQPPRILSLVPWLVGLFLLAEFPLLAGYKVVLKDGNVLEAKSKPISMGGHYRFHTTDNKFHALPLSSINLDATRKSNPSQQRRRNTRPLTNEDVAHSGSSSPPPSSPGSSKKSKAGQPAGTPSGQAHNEAYWRGRAGAIHQKIAAVDQEIQKAQQKVDNHQGKGIQLPTDTYRQIGYIVDYEAKIKQLEQEKVKLQQQLAQLEDEARRSGAMPGWLR